MSVLVFAESTEGKYKKNVLELVSYGKALAGKMQVPLIVLTAFAEDFSPLAQYGADKVWTYNGEALHTSDVNVWAEYIASAARKAGAKVVLFDSGANGVYVAPMVAVKLQAGYASNVVALPESFEPFVIKRKAYSNKAFAFTQINTDIKVLNLFKNSFGLIENPVEVQVENIDVELPAPRIKRTSVDMVTGKVNLSDAEIVVSGGRGLKSGDNWGMIEELAEVLDAATACSKPVADLGWRPHSEHVGQTGKQIASNVYFAIGISGAIQHLAGVNSSKIKIVINTDPEAPFFKAAEYGIVGDAFEVVPELTKKIKAIKAGVQ